MRKLFIKIGDERGIVLQKGDIQSLVLLKNGSRRKVINEILAPVAPQRRKFRLSQVLHSLVRFTGIEDISFKMLSYRCADSKIERSIFGKE